MSWFVQFNNKAAKQLQSLPENIKKRARALVRAIEITGPVQGEWPNYSKLGRDSHHCHLTYKYVVVWKIINN